MSRSLRSWSECYRCIEGGEKHSLHPGLGIEGKVWKSQKRALEIRRETSGHCIILIRKGRAGVVGRGGFLLCAFSTANLVCLQIAFGKAEKEIAEDAF